MPENGKLVLVTARVSTGAVTVTAPPTSPAPARVLPGKLAPAGGPETRCLPDVRRFFVLSGQLVLLLAFIRLFRIEEPAFVLLSAVVFAGFCVHYWLPFRLKEPFWIALSMAGAFLLIDPLAAALVIAAGLAMFAVLRAPLSFRLRLGIVLALFGAVGYGRLAGPASVPAQFWPVFGALFMFRIIVYLYELSNMRGRPRLREYLSYFFLLPNYYFLLFPVIDFQTLRRSYFKRDIHDIAQQGIQWMTRGVVQLTLYRLVSYVKADATPDKATPIGSMAIIMVSTYLLYLRVSGQFHIIAGMLHLFGYDLPETHRRWLLASSISDFWRRINIYWKDFLVKIAYFPVYFKLRKKGETRAQVFATAAVFLVTWALHSYQFFWLRGEFLVSWPDTVFWGVLGALMIGNLLLDMRRRRPEPRARWMQAAAHSCKVAGTFVLITVLWSVWHSATLGDAVSLMTSWTR